MRSVRTGFDARATRALSLLWCAAALLAFVGCRTTPTRAPSAVEALLGASRSARTPGAAILVAHDGVVLQRASYGMADLERGVAFQVDTASNLASVSKQFTAMAIMMLAEQGRLDYDDPITRLLPELARFGDAITIRHLLTHTSGLPDYYEVIAEISGVERPLTRHALDVYSQWGEPRFAPGERYEYSNPGYELLALIVERASGERFAEFIDERIFTPLGMASSVVYDEREPEIAKRAYGYRAQPGGFALDDDDPLNYIFGSGSIYSTVDDLYRWDQALYTEKLVSRATIAEAFESAQLASGEPYPYGFGWQLDDHLARRRIAHSGGWVGFSSFIARYVDDRFTVIVLTNSAEGGAEGIADTIAALYLSELDVANPPASTVIASARVLDGSGASERAASVRFVGDRIVEVGSFEASPRDAVIDAGGLALAPGFIDTHSHADDDLFEHPDALAAVSQGITTAVVGQDGGSPYPLRDFFDRLAKQPPALNIASYAGFGTIRDIVMGGDFRRLATPAEIEAMRALLVEEMLSG
ncbi:MAG TPA: serine hydrolase, partial [Myxococcota bacterium]|nr:serine hydrolase [Myxococcota bacterium]